MKINKPPLHPLVGTQGSAETSPSPKTTAPSPHPETGQQPLLDAFERVVSRLLQAPQGMLRTGNEEALGSFLSQGQFEQTQLLGDLALLADDMASVSVNTLRPHMGMGIPGRAQITAGPEGLKASGQAHVSSLTQGHLQRQLRGQWLNGDLRASGKVGPEAWAQGQLRADQTGLQGQGSIGAQLQGEVGLDTSLRSALLRNDTQIRAGGTLGIEAKGQVALDQKGLVGHVDALARAEVEARLNSQFQTAGVQIGGERLDVNAQVQMFARAGARAGVDADVAATIDPPRLGLDAKAGAFAGAKAGVEGKVGLGPFVAVKGRGEAWAGAGAEAGLIAGLKEGKLSFGFHAGAAAKAGAGFKWSVEVDVQKLAKAAIGGTLEATERALSFAINPLGAIDRALADVSDLLKQSSPGTIPLTDTESPLPFSRLLPLLALAPGVKQGAQEAVSQAVSQLSGTEPS